VGSSGGGPHPDGRGGGPGGGVQQGIKKSWIKKLDCDGLKKAITELRNELAQRAAELIEDKYNLPQSGPMSVEGHQQKFREQQIKLREALDQWNTKGCGGGLPPDARKWSTAPVPSPRRQTNPDQAQRNPNAPSPAPAHATRMLIVVGIVIIIILIILGPKPIPVVP
jgi:hypothetical protein